MRKVILLFALVLIFISGCNQQHVCWDGSKVDNPSLCPPEQFVCLDGSIVTNESACCHDLNSTCSSDSNCCFSMSCIQGSCNWCSNSTSQCEDNEQCCNSLSCEFGRCVPQEVDSPESEKTFSFRIPNECYLEIQQDLCYQFLCHDQPMGFRRILCTKTVQTYRESEDCDSSIFDTPEKQIECRALAEYNYTTCKEIESADARDECIKKAGIALLDDDICTEINNAEKKDECLLYVAPTKPELDLCSEISDNNTQKECLINLASITQNLSICELLGNKRDICIFRYVSYGEQNPFEMNGSACDSIENSNTVEGCKNNLALNRLLKNAQQDSGWCDLAAGTQNIDMCYYNLALSKHNSSLCSKVADGSLRDSCLTYSGFQYYYPPIPNYDSGEIVVSAHKKEYKTNETMTIGVYSGISAPVYLDGCNPYVFEKEIGVNESTNETLWETFESKACFAASKPQKIDSLGFLRFQNQIIESGTYRVSAHPYLSCEENIDGLDCMVDWTVIYSDEFNVTD